MPTRAPGTAAAAPTAQARLIGALGPKPCRLARHAELRWRVAQKLVLQWSPEQISGWLKRQFPADQGMQVSHETIYRSLFIQTRGVLKKELMAHLRTARQMRQTKGGTTKSGLGQIVDALSIRERPAEVEDRAVPGQLGRRSSLWREQYTRRNARRAPYSLHDASQGPKQEHGDRGSRAR